MKNRRSPFVNWTRPRIWRRSTVSGCLSAAFSASSRLLDLKSEATRFKQRHISATILVDVKRFSHQINTDEVFDTHRSPIRVQIMESAFRELSSDGGAVIAVRETRTDAASVWTSI